MIIVLAVALALSTVFILNNALKAVGWICMNLERRRFERWLSKGV
jgi:hypothetical protein